MALAIELAPSMSFERDVSYSLFLYPTLKRIEMFSHRVFKNFSYRIHRRVSHSKILMKIRWSWSVWMVSAIALLVTSCSSSPERKDETTVADADNASAVLKWNISLWGNPRAATEGAESLARRIAERTNGAWEIELNYGEALSKSRENLDGLVINAFEGAMFCNIYHPQKTPALMVLALPFLPLTDWDDNRKVRDAIYAHPTIIEEAKRWNAVLYVSSFLPSNEFMGRGKPPLNLADWEGLTVRAGGGIGKAMQILGATPTSSTATEVYTGVQQGTMDAAAFPFTYAHVTFRIHEVSDWYTSNMRIGTSECPIAFSIDAYSALSDEYKHLLQEVKESVIDDQIAAYIEADAKNEPMLEASLEKITYSSDDISRFRSIAGMPVIEAWINENQDKFDAEDLVQTVFKAVDGSNEGTVSTDE